MIDTVAHKNVFSHLVLKQMNSCQCNESSVGLYTDTPLLTQFQTYEILKQGKNNWNKTFETQAQYFLAQNESAVRWQKNTVGRQHRRWGKVSHAPADQVPMCWNLDFNCIPLYTHTVNHIYSMFRPDLRKIRLAPDLPERSYSASQEVSIFPRRKAAFTVN
jgi:hypothetical protein